MSSLFDGLRSSVNALKATGNALAVTEMNLTNANVTGYARQDVSLLSDSFDTSRQQAGGAHSTSSSARSLYAEQAVWSQSSQQGYYDTLTQSANGVDQILGTSGFGQSGMQGSLSALFQSFDQLQIGSSDPVNQQDVIQKAQAFALTVSQTGNFLAEGGAMAQSRIQETVSQINGLVQSVQQFNAQLAAGTQSDPMSEAKVYAGLEQLSSLIPINVQKDTTGSLTILLNGKTALLQGSIASPLSVGFQPPDASAPFPDAPATLRIMDAAGNDVTDGVSGGQLGGLIQYTNGFLPTLLGDGNQQGDVNRLAQGMADAVNSALGGAKPMFVYDATSTDAARSLKLNPSFTAADLATAIASNPSALTALGQIPQGATAATQINGQSFSQFFVTMSTRISTDLSTAQNGQNLSSGMVEQAKSLRESVQGASIQDSAVQLLEYQQAFQAASKVISVIDQLTQTTMDIVK